MSSVESGASETGSIKGGTMNLGFTGTRQQPTDAQLQAFIRLLEELKPIIFRHGDCIGADAAAHELVDLYYPDCRIIIHPPVDSSCRAWMKGDEILPPKTFFARNRDIVDASECVIGMPVQECTPYSAGKGGTYFTLDYAEKSRDKRIIAIMPDGTMQYTWPVS